ncbi:cob(I)yrinic acid a,c-diamide adenosyltransferase [Gluconobacter wancherniae]|uniref:cob(I)yrinic acid a,c-diamide adenosyltransferase n=1 Tax=Gluconobacter wancherniae TaxID=1307955 RepID=UPI00309D06B8
MNIRIDRVVTRGGDGGETSLGDGTRVSKGSARIEAMGSIDELNATLGLLRYHVEHDRLVSVHVADIARLQSCVLDLGADLCMPVIGRPSSLPSEAVRWLEARIEALRLSQPELRSFVLPGGSLVAAHAHLARTVARRAERALVQMENAPVEGMRFLNRLSDYFFVFGRHANNDGRDDILWQPGTWKNDAINIGD